MALESYTSYREIRAVLGVTDDELEDAVLELELYYQHLLVELRDIASALPADFATVLEVAEEDRTDAQAGFYSAMKLFAPHCVAVMLLPGLPLLAQRAITDGKAGITRFSGEPWKKTIERVQAMFERLRTALANAYETYTGGTAATVFTRPYMAVSSPDSDPVTNT